jgi:transmembrane sensor
MRIPVLAGRYKSAEERTAIEAEAARLFLKARTSDTEQDWNDAFSWIAADPSHGVAFAKVEASWEATDLLRDGPLAATQLDEVAPGPLNFLASRRIFAGLLAVTIVGAVCTFAVQFHGAIDRYRTRLGEERAITLADGSVLHLNTATSVEVSLRDNSRTVDLLKGEARFDVAHDRARPFYVNTGSASVRAIGTAFNVRLRADVTELTVIQGAVAVRDGTSSSKRVVAGTAAAIRSGTVAVTPLAPKHLAQRIAWQHGQIEFEGDTIAQAVEEFNRYRTTPLVIGDPQIAGIRIGGTFRSDRSQDFVHALEQGFGIRAVIGHDRSIILMPPA